MNNKMNHRIIFLKLINFYKTPTLALYCFLDNKCNRYQNLFSFLFLKINQNSSLKLYLISYQACKYVPMLNAHVVIFIDGFSNKVSKMLKITIFIQIQGNEYTNYQSLKFNLMY